MTIFKIVDDYVLMTPNEAYSLKTYKHAIREAANFCKQNGLRKILADITKSREVSLLLTGSNWELKSQLFWGARFKWQFLRRA